MERISLLNTSQLNDEIERMFKDEQKNLVIFSPYIDISDALIDILASSKACIYLFYRKDEDRSPKKIKKIEEMKGKLKNVKFYEIPNLHAKIYLSVNFTIITSLNLYEYSQKNNYEIGILFDNNDFGEIYDQLKSELRIILSENNYDKNILDEKKEYKHGNWYNMKYLYRDLMEKYNFNWASDYPDDIYYDDVCKKMLEKYKDKFPEKDFNGGVLFRQAMITPEMYDYGMYNIKIEKH